MTEVDEAVGSRSHDHMPRQSIAANKGTNFVNMIDMNERVATISSDINSSFRGTITTSTSKTMDFTQSKTTEVDDSVCVRNNHFTPNYLNPLDLSTGGTKSEMTPSTVTLSRDSVGSRELGAQGLPGGSILCATATNSESPSPVHRPLQNNSPVEVCSNGRLLQTAPKDYLQTLEPHPFSLNSPSTIVSDDHSHKVANIDILTSNLTSNSDRTGQLSKRPFNLIAPDSPYFYPGHTPLSGPVGSPPVNLASVAALSSLYDGPSHQTSVSPSSVDALGFGMTSYLMARKRRQEAKEKEKEKEHMSLSKRAPAVPSESNSQSGSEDMDSKKLKTVPDEKKDDAYWERRRKNNEAAKRSRDARRQKEEEIAMRAAFLEQENLKLRAQVAVLKNETAKLHYLLYNSRV